MKRMLMAAVTALLYCINSLAQGFDPTVEVSRTFDVRLGEINKPELPVSVPDSLLKFDHATDYSIFEKPYGNLYEFSPYDALKIKPMDPVLLPLLYARVGMRFPVAPLVDLHLQKALQGGTYLNVALRHGSFFGSAASPVGGDAFSERNTDNDAAARLKYVWATGEAGIGLHGTYGSRHTTGSGGEGIRNRAGRFGVVASVNSTNESENEVYYDFKMRFDRSHSSFLTDVLEEKLAVLENAFALEGRIGTTFDVHRVYIDMSIRYADYDKFKDYTVSVVEFSPIYEYSSRRFNGRFGVKFGNRFGLQEPSASKAPDGNNLSALSSVFPDVDARYEIISQSLWVHAVIGGGFDLNSYGDLSLRVPMLSPNTPMKMGSRPLDATLSLEGTIFGRFAMNLSGGFSMERGRPVFEPVVPAGNAPAEIRLGFLSMNDLSCGVDAFWKSSTVTTGGEFRLHRYFALGDAPAVTQLPTATGRLYFRYNWRERVIGSLDYDFRSPISGDTFGAWSAPWIHNLNLTVDYVLNRHLTIYGKFGNLLNRHNQYVPYYAEPGFSFGGGVALIF